MRAKFELSFNCSHSERAIVVVEYRKGCFAYETAFKIGACRDSLKETDKHFGNTELLQLRKQYGQDPYNR